MNTIRLNELYIAAVQAAITNSKPVPTFSEWNQARQDEENSQKQFYIPIHSDFLGLVTFHVHAKDLPEANEKARELCTKVETKYRVERGAGGKILTLAEQKEKMIKHLQSMIAADERRKQRKIRKIQKLLSQ